MNKLVEQKFNKYPEHIRPLMEELRSLIFKIAKQTTGVGELEETLKWGEPAYLTSKTKSGTTVRIDWKPKHPEQIGLYVSCQSTLVGTWRTMFRDVLQFEGNRAIILPTDKPFPVSPLSVCIKMALRYHLEK